MASTSAAPGRCFLLRGQSGIFTVNGQGAIINEEGRANTRQPRSPWFHSFDLHYRSWQSGGWFRDPHGIPERMDRWPHFRRRALRPSRHTRK